MQRAFTNIIYNSLVHNHDNTEITIRIDKIDKIILK